MTDLLILWLLLFLWCWDYPADHFLRRLIRLPAGPLVYFGLWHSWAMFAPHPVHLNRRLVALVTLSDGTRQQWQPLSSEGQSLLRRMLYVRSFKFEFSLFSPGGERLYQPVCEFVAQQAAGAGQVVQSIELIRLTQNVNSWSSVERFGAERADRLFQWSPQGRLQC